MMTIDSASTEKLQRIWNKLMDLSHDSNGQKKRFAIRSAFWLAPYLNKRGA